MHTLRINSPENLGREYKSPQRNFTQRKNMVHINPLSKQDRFKGVKKVCDNDINQKKQAQSSASSSTRSSMRTFNPESNIKDKIKNLITNTNSSKKQVSNRDSDYIYSKAHRNSFTQQSSKLKKYSNTKSMKTLEVEMSQSPKINNFQPHFQEVQEVQEFKPDCNLEQQFQNVELNCEQLNDNNSNRNKALKLKLANSKDDLQKVVSKSINKNDASVDFKCLTPRKMNDTEAQQSVHQKKFSVGLSVSNLTHITPNITFDYMNVNFGSNPLTQSGMSDQQFLNLEKVQENIENTGILNSPTSYISSQYQRNYRSDKKREPLSQNNSVINQNMYSTVKLDNLIEWQEVNDLKNTIRKEEKEIMLENKKVSTEIQQNALSPKCKNVLSPQFKNVYSPNVFKKQLQQNFNNAGQFQQQINEQWVQTEQYQNSNRKSDYCQSSYKKAQKKGQNLISASQKKSQVHRSQPNLSTSRILGSEKKSAGKIHYQEQPTTLEFLDNQNFEVNNDNQYIFQQLTRDFKHFQESQSAKKSQFQDTIQEITDICSSREDSKNFSQLNRDFKQYQESYSKQKIDKQQQSTINEITEVISDLSEQKNIEIKDNNLYKSKTNTIKTPRQSTIHFEKLQYKNLINDTPQIDDSTLTESIIKSNKKQLETTNEQPFALQPYQQGTFCSQNSRQELQSDTKGTQYSKYDYQISEYEEKKGSHYPKNPQQESCLVTQLDQEIESRFMQDMQEKKGTFYSKKSNQSGDNERKSTWQFRSTHYNTQQDLQSLSTQQDQDLDAKIRQYTEQNEKKGTQYSKKSNYSNDSERKGTWYFRGTNYTQENEVQSNQLQKSNIEGRKSQCSISQDVKQTGSQKRKSSILVKKKQEKFHSFRQNQKSQLKLIK